MRIERCRGPRQWMQGASRIRLSVGEIGVFWGPKAGFDLQKSIYIFVMVKVPEPVHVELPVRVQVPVMVFPLTVPVRAKVLPAGVPD